MLSGLHAAHCAAQAAVSMHCMQPAQVALMAHTPPPLVLDVLDVVELDVLELDVLELDELAPVLDELALVLELLTPLLVWEVVAPLLAALVVEVVPIPPAPAGSSSAPRTSAQAGAATAATAKASGIQVRGAIRTLR